jgi:hypothetical protein
LQTLAIVAASSRLLLLLLLLLRSPAFQIVTAPFVFLQVVISVLLDFSPPLLWGYFYFFFFSLFSRGMGFLSLLLLLLLSSRANLASLMVCIHNSPAKDVPTRHSFT